MLKIKTYDVTTFGNVVNDVIVNVESSPVYPDVHQRLTHPLHFTLGGCANALIAAARLGASTSAIGLVPPPCDTTSHLLTSNIYETLKRNRIGTSALLTHREGTLNSCVIITPPHPAEHTFISTNGAPPEASLKGAASPTSFLFPEQIISAIDAAHCLLLDSYVLMDSSSSMITAVLQQCKKSSTDLYYDLQTVPSIPLTSEILPAITGLFLTVDAALVLTETSKLAEAIEQLPKLVPPNATILLKQGAKGAIIIEGSSRNDMIRVPPFKPQVVADCVGAGDGFAGAYLTGIYTYKWDKRMAAEMASAMGAATCENRGTGEEGMGSVEQLMRLLGQTKLGLKVKEELEDAMKIRSAGE